MCGLIGFVGKNNQTADVGKLKSLLYINSKERKSEDSIGYWTKEENSVYKSIQGILFEVAFLEELETSCFLGHVRAKTTGAIDLKSAHPFVYSNIVGAHNGTLTDLANTCRENEELKLTYDYNRVDSTYIFEALANLQNPSALRYFQGAMAVIFSDINDSRNHLYVYRNSERPLFRGMTTEGMYISSEWLALELIGCKDIKPFKEEYFYTIVDGEITSTLRLPKKPVKPSISTGQGIPPTKVWVKVKHNKDLWINSVRTSFGPSDYMLIDASPDNNVSLANTRSYRILKIIDKDLNILHNNVGLFLYPSDIDMEYFYPIKPDMAVKVVNSWYGFKDKERTVLNHNDVFALEGSICIVKAVKSTDEIEIEALNPKDGTRKFTVSLSNIVYLTSDELIKVRQDNKATFEKLEKSSKKFTSKLTKLSVSAEELHAKLEEIKKKYNWTEESEAGKDLDSVYQLCIK